MSAFVFLPTRCALRQCGRAFFGAGSRCEKCERIRIDRNAGREFAGQVAEALGVQAWRIVPKPKRAYTISPEERQRRAEQIQRVNRARRA